MKKLILSIVSLLAMMGVSASNYEGTNITLANANSPSGTNDMQLITLQSAGALYDFANTNDQYQYFGQNDYRNIVVFSGPMNTDDLGAIAGQKWQHFVALDFSNVTGVTADDILSNMQSSNANARLIVFPITAQLTQTQIDGLKNTVSAEAGRRFYAYYKNNDATMVSQMFLLSAVIII